ncbi:MAG: hypothetical protein AMK69_15055 [Nitrospira bacterium SG8_3]|nr:MAG: hypothetical protein AMK69_15055 [Nitrospira bacterium SG8_3]
MEKVIISHLSVFILFVLGYNSASAETRRIELNFVNQTLSATIKSAPLRTVIAEIEEEKGVWFKLWLRGEDSLLDEKVSVRFKNLPVKEGLDRIFSPLNHCLVFDQDGNLSGVVLFGKPEPRRDWSRRRRVTPRRTPSRYRRQ